MPRITSTDTSDRAATSSQVLAFGRCAVFALLAVFGSPAISQVDRSAYRDSTIDEVIITLRLPVGPTDSAEAVAVLLPPEFKYRLKVNATGNIRQLTPDTAAALSDWGRTEPGLPAFLKEYTHEVEVTANDRSVWLIWQRALVAPFRAERSNGGTMDVYAICAGAFRGRLLLLVTAFESLG
jgi:hypothetical protein